MRSNAAVFIASTLLALVINHCRRYSAVGGELLLPILLTSLWIFIKSFLRDKANLWPEEVRRDVF